MTDKFCVSSRRWLGEKLDGAPLPFWARFMVRMHLRFCPQCIRYNRSLVETKLALRSLADRDPDEK